MTIAQVATMKAVVLREFGDPNRLASEQIDIPIPGPGEIQMQIVSAAVNPVDWKICNGFFIKMLEHRFPLIPGWDASGIVSAVGEGVKKFKVGDPVFAYCRKPVVQFGTFAEYICIDADHAARKPKNISFQEAAAFPLAGLTVWQAFFDLLKLKKGESILIHAGAGGVGSIAIQLAKNAGAYVLATASESNLTYLKSLGVDVAIDYRLASISESVKQALPEGVDMVLDTIGGETYKESFELLKRGGRIVSLHEEPNEVLAKQYDARPFYLFVKPNGEELQKIADLIEAEKILSIPIRVMPLEDAGKALELLEKGHTRGKIVLQIDENFEN